MGKLPLALMPGLMSTKEAFDYQLKNMADIADMHYIDLSDCSRSTDMARKALATMPGRFAILADSMGGFASLEIFDLAPERISLLMLISTSPLADSDKQRRNRLNVVSKAEGGADLWRDIWCKADLWHPDNRTIRSLREKQKRMCEELGTPVFIRHMRAIAERTSVLHLLPKIRCPTLIMHSPYDRVWREDAHSQMHKLIPDSTLVRLDKGGHMAIHECPEQVTAELRKFILAHPVSTEAELAAEWDAKVEQESRGSRRGRSLSWPAPPHVGVGDGPAAGNGHVVPDIPPPPTVASPPPQVSSPAPVSHPPQAQAPWPPPATHPAQPQAQAPWPPPVPHPAQPQAQAPWPPPAQQGSSAPQPYNAPPPAQQGSNWPPPYDAAPPAQQGSSWPPPYHPDAASRGRTSHSSANLSGPSYPASGATSGIRRHSAPAPISPQPGPPGRPQQLHGPSYPSPGVGGHRDPRLSGPSYPSSGPSVPGAPSYPGSVSGAPSYPGSGPGVPGAPSTPPASSSSASSWPPPPPGAPSARPSSPHAPSWPPPYDAGSGPSAALTVRTGTPSAEAGYTSGQHEALDVYPVYIEFLVIASRLAERIPSGYASLRDQLDRASKSILLNMTQGQSENNQTEQSRLYDLARSYAHECAAVFDAAWVLNCEDPDALSRGKSLIHRMVAMLDTLTGGRPRNGTSAPAQTYGGQPPHHRRRP